MGKVAYIKLLSFVLFIYLGICVLYYCSSKNKVEILHHGVRKWHNGERVYYEY